MANYVLIPPRVSDRDFYIGASTDTKPPSPEKGSLAYETDTKTTYIWDGTTWQDYGSSDGGGITTLVNRTPTHLAFVGELAGSATAVQMPSKAGILVRITAAYDNVGRVYVGLTGVTKKDGTTDTTTGKPLEFSESAWFFLDANLNELYYICDNAGDDLIYEVYAV